MTDEMKKDLEKIKAALGTVRDTVKEVQEFLKEKENSNQKDKK